MNQIKVEKRTDGNDKLAVLLVVNVIYFKSSSLKVCI